MHAELREAGTMVNRKRVERVMREHGIVGRHQRRRYRTTVPAPAAAAVPDLLRRDFSVGRADERWCGDVTYLPVAGRWMFLATVIDIGTRRVVGYSMAEHMHAELVVDALNAAVRTRGGEVPSVIFNSDHGGQYASAAFAGACAAAGIRQSMGAAGSSADNALAEAPAAGPPSPRPAWRSLAGWPSTTPTAATRLSVISARQSMRSDQLR